MFDHYVKLFDILPTIENWLVEALIMVFGGFILAYIICKITDSFKDQ
jgi:hypothetical protein